MSKVNCIQCSNEMHKTTQSVHNRTAQAGGCLIFIVGICLLFIVPIGTFIGIIMIIWASRMGYKREKVWSCKNCGYFFERR